VVNSTLSGNAAGGAGYGGDDGGVGGIGGSGGGIANRGSLTLRSSTITDNAMGGDAFCDCDATEGSPGVGGGIFNSGGVFAVANSIIAMQYAGSDCAGTPPTAQRYSVHSDGTCGHTAGPGNQPFGNLHLGPLLDYGGPTPTRALLRGSAAIDQGDPAGCVDAEGHLIATDQRGLPRRQGGRCDVGAFELQPGEGPLTEVTEPILTALRPLKVWIGLDIGRDNSVFVDLRAEIYLNDKLIGVGLRRNVPGGGKGFAQARLQTIPLRLLAGPRALSSHDKLSLVLYAENACPLASAPGRVVLWWDDAEANSGFGATVDGADRTYYIRGNYNLGLVPGLGPKSQSSIDVEEDSCGYQPQFGFGSWSFGPAVGDFNGDGMADVLWRHTSGALQVWFVRGGGGTDILGTAPVASLDNDWVIQGIADFNGDGTADILWRHTSGAVVLWLMRGTEVIGTGSLGTLTGDWTIQGVGDVNGDGKADILLRHTSGQIYIWYMDGTSMIGGGSPGSVADDWAIVGVGDFNGDGKADVLWRDTSGQVHIWLMNGTRISRAGSVAMASPDWTVVGVGDFDQDRKADILWRHTSGAVSLWLMDGTTVVKSGSLPAMGTDWSVVGVADYAGFGAANVLWRDTSGNVYMWYVHRDFSVGSGRMGSITTDWHAQ
jgi:hypothetical protein